MQAYPRLDVEFLPTLAAAVLNRQDREPSRWLRSLLDKIEKVKRVGPTHSHILQTYLGLNPEFWPTYAVAVSIIRPAVHDAEARQLS